ncbi:response regulator transcription factor [Luteipulveratus mongoliensis]|uniref:Transcriptional regulator n=1 Tax=Luteipulveratus mongoliensis TaxID=571913 RepID=A0A0K1JFP3_9MICO|nr:response regulator transcription factor [Luteipulveratus mongoliensis]AKU15403.1 hypothetical protein VV02_05190 [Luteipulveratus mongoliensis]
MADVLLIEDDTSVAAAVGLGLRRLGHTVEHVPDGRGDLAPLLARNEVIVLDLGLPGVDGYDVCRQVRASEPTFPIVVLTARSDDADIVASLEAGADDYVVKPVTPRVLDARIKAVLRRTRPPVVTETVHAETVTFGGLSIDHAAMQVYLDDALVALTPTELRTLIALAEHPGRLYSRDELYRIVWGSDHRGDSRAVDTAMQRLRSKIDDDPKRAQFIETVRGFGYRFTGHR